MLKTQPNTTEIPNIVIDYWLSKLPKPSALILIYFCRKSYCVTTHTEVITLVQIQKQTGFSMAAVLRAIDHLLAHNLIKKYEPKFKGCRTSYFLTLDVVSVAEVVREEAMQEVIEEIKTESKKEVDLGYIYNNWLPRLHAGDAVVLLCIFRVQYAQTEISTVGLADLEIMTRYSKLSLKKYLNNLCLHGVVVRVDERNHQYKIGKL
jgi:predicted transcriptional regulator